MPKEKNAEQEALESAESSEQESTQEAQEVKEQTEEKGFFAKITEKAKEAASELFTESKDEPKEEAKTQATPKRKSILKKGVKFASVTAFIYKGEDSFTLKIGAYPYIIQSGEVFIVPNDKTATYLRYKEQLFSEITD